MEHIITKANVDEAVAFVRAHAPVEDGALGLVLGSGLGELVDAIEDAAYVDYAEIPHMVSSTAPSHAGRFVIGTIAGRPVICMQGRLHAYEGNSPQQIAFPICLMHGLGVTELVVTNAAGGINTSFDVGDLMLIEDHINLLGANPLAAPDEPELFPRFYDMTQAYSPALRERAQKAAASCEIELKSGVYIATMGPSFETPAEIRAFRTLGADAVGMSTVFEVIAARACGMEVLGISMISNAAAGVLDEPVSIDDVYVAAEAAVEKLSRLLIAYAGDSVPGMLSHK